MKNLFLLYALFHCLLVSAQSSSDEIVSKTIGKNTYNARCLTYTKTMFNAVYPFEKENAAEWRDHYVVTGFGMHPALLVDKYIGPYLKDIVLEEDDQLVFYIWYTLQGEVAYVIYSFPLKVNNIPFEAIDRLETALKMASRLDVSPIVPGRQVEVYYIYTRIPFNLKAVRERTVVSSYPEASWNDDLIVWLKTFGPINKYENEQSRYREIYPDMFNYTDDCGKDEANTYIVGAGGATITFDVQNQTKQPLTLDPMQIRVELDNGLFITEPRISRIICDYKEIDKKVDAKDIVIQPGGYITLTFELENIIDDRHWWSGRVWDYKMSFWHGTKSMFNYIVDRRYEFTKQHGRTEATWYRKGYFMFRYMYDNDHQNMFYDKTKGTFSY